MSERPRSGSPAKGPGHGGERRGYSWPTATPGNTIALKHGAFSRYALAEADDLAATVVEYAPHLAEADAPALRDYCIAQARAWRLGAWIEEHGELDETGKPRPALTALREWLHRSEQARSRLGLDPASRASLAVDELGARLRAKDLAEHDLDEGRRLREAAEGNTP